eukprot:4390987-Ditylum_brightwellii.AAC.1
MLLDNGTCHLDANCINGESKNGSCDDDVVQKKNRKRYAVSELVDACLEYFEFGIPQDKEFSSTAMFPKGHQPPPTTIMYTCKKSYLLDLKERGD